MIEAALSFSTFLLLTFGVMEFSMVVYAYNFCSYVSRDAARYASVRGATASSPVNADQIRDYIKNQAIGLVANQLTVTTEWIPDNEPGSDVKISVRYQVVPLAGLAVKNMTVGSAAQLTIVH